MEVDQIRYRFSRICNGHGEFVSTKLDQRRKMDDRYPDDEEERENKRSTANDTGGGAGVDLGGDVGRLYGWPSSRIVRVSRASGGKDRHSKVLTSKGPRDRRVRLSVNTAIKFYDLQDRLGFDQPSKAVEWLLAAAATSIAELPPMSATFPDTTKQLNDEKRSRSCQLGFESAEVDMDGGGGAKSSAGSSNSETSKGSGLSISRSESRIKARERAKERVAEKEKEKEIESSYVASFTELLNGGISSINGSHNNNSSVHQNPNRENTDESTFFQKSTLDYFTSVFLGPPATRPAQIAASPLFTAAADHHHELQPFSFTPDNLVSPVNAANSSGLAAINRGTLQSNSLSSPLHRFPPTDGSPPNFFIGPTPPLENYHHFLSGFDAGLQLYHSNAHCYNNSRCSGQKGKDKS